MRVVLIALASAAILGAQSTERPVSMLVIDSVNRPTSD